jgi:hypothetical protein
MSNYRTERCQCRQVIPVGTGVLQTVVGQTAIYLCRECALAELAKVGPTLREGESDERDNEPDRQSHD